MSGDVPLQVEDFEVTADPILSKLLDGLVKSPREARGHAEASCSRVINLAAREVAALIAREVRARCSADATFSQRRDVAAMVMQEVLAKLAAADQKPEK